MMMFAKNMLRIHLDTFGPFILSVRSVQRLINHASNAVSWHQFPVSFVSLYQFVACLAVDTL